MTLLSESLDAADVTKLTQDGKIETTRNKQQLIKFEYFSKIQIHKTHKEFISFRCELSTKQK